MADGEAAKARQTYLVEHYRPGLEAEQLKRWAGRVRDAVDELERKGVPVRFLRATIVPRDESFLCVLEAASEKLVCEAYAGAGIPFERISLAITEDRSAQLRDREDATDPGGRT
jgi:hypothetical protein